MVMLEPVLLVCCTISFIQISVGSEDSDIPRIIINQRNRTTFDFQEVLEANNKFPQANDKCPLRITGGVDAGRGSIPYQVALRKEVQAVRQWSVFCGGAIITQSYVLTALHCLNSVKAKKVMVVGGTDVSNVFLSGNLVERLTKLKNIQKLESWRKIKACHGHSKFNNKKMINDFAVLEMDKPFVLAKDIQAIKILSYQNQKQYSVLIPDGTLCIVSGFGLIQDDYVLQKKRTENLQMVCLPLVSLDNCKKVYPDREHSNLTQICAGNDAGYSCTGDSGGPLVCKGFLVGIVSYGGEPGKVAGVYTFLRGYTNKQQKNEFYSCNSIKMCNNILNVLVFIALPCIIIFI